jgi:hypothetical protein
MNRSLRRIDYRMGGHCFVPAAGTKQSHPRMKPISAFGEGIPKRLTVNQLRNEKAGRPKTCATARDMGTVMIKALSAVAVAAAIAAGLTILPGFAPQVEASVPQALAKSDRLDIRPIGRDCSAQAWPNFEAACLRSAVSRKEVRQARLVTADRTP